MNSKAQARRSGSALSFARKGEEKEMYVIGFRLLELCYSNRGILWWTSREPAITILLKEEQTGRLLLTSGPLQRGEGYNEMKETVFCRYLTPQRCEQKKPSVLQVYYALTGCGKSFLITCSFYRSHSLHINSNMSSSCSRGPQATIHPPLGHVYIRDSCSPSVREASRVLRQSVCCIDNTTFLIHMSA